MVHETPHGNLYPLRSPLMGAAKSGGGTGTRLLTPYPCPAAPGAAQPVCRTHPALQDQRAFFSGATIQHHFGVLVPTQTQRWGKEDKEAPEKRTVPGRVACASSWAKTRPGDTCSGF